MISYIHNPEILFAAELDVEGLFRIRFPRIGGPITRIDGDLREGTREHLVFLGPDIQLQHHIRLLEEERFGIGTRLIKATRLPTTACGE